MEIENHHFANITIVAGKNQQQIVEIVGKCLIGIRMFSLKISLLRGCLLQRKLTSQISSYPHDQSSHHQYEIYQHHAPPDLKNGDTNTL